MFFSRRVYLLFWFIDLSRFVVGLLIEKWSREILYNVIVILMYMISVVVVLLKLFLIFDF